MRRLTPRTAFLLFLGLVALFVVIERAIVTDEEAIEALLEDLEDAAREQDWDRFLAVLHVDYQAEGRNAEEAVEYAASLMKQYRPVDLTMYVGNIDVDGDDAEARTNVGATVSGQPIRVKVAIDLKRTDDGWRVTAARPLGWGL